VIDRGPVFSVSHTILAGAKLAQAFATSVVPGPPKSPSGFEPGGGGPGGVDGPGGSGGLAGPAGGGGGAGGGSGGGKLPFTGLGIAFVAAVGVALAAAGDVLRRLTGRQPAREDP
jgi:hypothetical protein